MKKTFTVLALLLISTLTFAAKPLKVKSGDLSFKQEAVLARLVMDYSNATWEGRQSSEEFCGEDYGSRTASVSWLVGMEKPFRIRAER